MPVTRQAEPSSPPSATAEKKTDNVFRKRASSSAAPHPSASVSTRQHTSAHVSTCQHTSAYISIRQRTSAYVSIRQPTSASVSICQRTSACVSIRECLAQAPPPRPPPIATCGPFSPCNACSVAYTRPRTHLRGSGARTRCMPNACAAAALVPIEGHMQH